MFTDYSIKHPKSTILQACTASVPPICGGCSADIPSNLKYQGTELHATIICSEIYEQTREGETHDHEC